MSELDDPTASGHRFDYQCDHQRRRVRVRFGSTATSADFMAVIDRQVSDSAWTYGLLYDLTARLPGAKEGAARVARYLELYARTLGARGPVAIVTQHDTATRATLTYGPQGRSLGFQAGVFTDPVSAERWLDERSVHRGTGNGRAEQ